MTMMRAPTKLRKYPGITTALFDSCGKRDALAYAPALPGDTYYTVLFRRFRLLLRPLRRTLVGRAPVIGRHRFPPLNAASDRIHIVALEAAALPSRPSRGPARQGRVRLNVVACSQVNVPT
jgi:hypothetical protein